MFVTPPEIRPAAVGSHSTEFDVGLVPLPQVHSVSPVFVIVPTMIVVAVPVIVPFIVIPVIPAASPERHWNNESRAQQKSG
jgi:hypothetical protein